MELDYLEGKKKIFTGEPRAASEFPEASKLWATFISEKKY